MIVRVDYSDRDLVFSAGNDQGKGLENLIKYIGKNQKDIDKVVIRGKSSSYTFLRQVSLFVNMVSTLSGIGVNINSQEITPSNPYYPTYE